MSAFTKFLGLVLICVGVFCLISLAGLIEPIGASFYATVQLYPSNFSSADQKISSTLKEKLRYTSGDEYIPVVIKLTAPTGAMALAQQQTIVPLLMSYGFQPTMMTTKVANTVSGRVQAKNIIPIASNPNIEAVYLDTIVAHIDVSDFDVHLLKDSVPMIRAPEVWKEGYTGKGVVVVIIDSGVQDNHPWLMRGDKSLVLEEYSVVPGAKDYTHWHGTHCAGIIASQDATYKGVAPDIEGFVDILSFDYMGSAYFSWVIAALDKAYTSGSKYKSEGKAVVFTNSWGGPPIDTPEMNEVRRLALKLTDIGPVFFAAGNSGPAPSTIGAPADADDGVTEIISVGAVDKSGNIAYFSSRGPDMWGSEHDEPDISAPGVSIVSSIPGGNREASGTSMACPHAAGVGALMLSKNRDLSNNDVLKLLMQTAVDKGDPGFDYAYGAGIIDAYEAVKKVQGSPVPPITPTNTTQILMVFSLLTGVVLFTEPWKRRG